MKKILFLLILISSTCRAALLFDGTDDYVGLGSNSSIQLSGEMTTASWVKFNSDYTSVQTIISNIASGGTNCTYHLEFGRTDNKFTWIQNGGSVDATSTGSISDNNWHHIAAIRTGSTGSWDISFYIDGVFDSTTHTTENPGASNGNTSLGRAGDFNGNYLNGTLEDMGLFNVALAASEIRELVRKSKYRGNSINRVALRGFYPLDNFATGATASGTNSIRDYSEYRNNGTPQNSPIGAAGTLLYATQVQ